MGPPEHHFPFEDQGCPASERMLPALGTDVPCLLPALSSPVPTLRLASGFNGQAQLCRLSVPQMPPPIPQPHG